MKRYETAPAAGAYDNVKNQGASAKTRGAGAYDNVTGRGTPAETPGAGRLETTLCGIRLENPVIAASGTLGYGYEFADTVDLCLLGSISVKGTTLQPRYGNPQPRIAEAPSGIVNSIGLQNPGIDEVLATEIPRLSAVFKKPFMANISGFSVDEYAMLAERLSGIEAVGWLEVNISCPNVHGGGESFGADPHLAALVTKSVRKVSKKPVIVKLSPNVADITLIAAACEDAGADGIALINTIRAMRIDPASRKPILANVTGGLSGPAVLPIALRMVYETASAVDIPIVGMGGISRPEDVIEMMMAGAAAVEVGAGTLRDPRCMEKIITGLPEVMDRYGIENLRDIIGAALCGPGSIDMPVLRNFEERSGMRQRNAKFHEKKQE